MRTNELIVAIGNADIWGPPRLMRMELLEDWALRGTASWTAEEDGYVDRLAFYVRGDWRLAEDFGYYEFAKHQRVDVTYTWTLTFGQQVIANEPFALLGEWKSLPQARA